MLVSPSSLATALAMLELGARGSTEQGIAAALDSTGLSASDQAAGWRALAAVLAAETSTGAASQTQEPQLDIANGLFLQKQFSVLPAFVGALTSEFKTGLWRVDFAHDLAGATGAINQWTSEHTMGLIKQLFSPGALTPMTVLVLADAVYFHADWAQSFEASTRGGPFYPSTGAVENVPFMRTPPVDSKNALTVPVSVTSGYDAVELPYSGRKLSALAVMPVGSSLAQFVSSLTPDGLARIVSGLVHAGGGALRAHLHAARRRPAQRDPVSDGHVAGIRSRSRLHGHHRAATAPGRLRRAARLPAGDAEGDHRRGSHRGQRDHERDRRGRPSGRPRPSLLVPHPGQHRRAPSCSSR